MAVSDKTTQVELVTRRPNARQRERASDTQHCIRDPESNTVRVIVLFTLRKVHGRVGTDCMIYYFYCYKGHVQTIAMTQNKQPFGVGETNSKSCVCFRYR